MKAGGGKVLNATSKTKLVIAEVLTLTACEDFFKQQHKLNVRVVANVHRTLRSWILWEEVCTARVVGSFDRRADPVGSTVAELSRIRMGTCNDRYKQQPISQASVRLLSDFARAGCRDWMGYAISLSLFRIDALRHRHDRDLVRGDQPLVD